MSYLEYGSILTHNETDALTDERETDKETHEKTDGEGGLGSDIQIGVKQYANV